jgi:hypothetical protein
LLAVARDSSVTHNKGNIMAIDVDDDGNRREPGIGLALLTVLGMILTIGVLSLLIWGLMIAVAATTAGRTEPGAAPVKSETVIDQKALPAKP